MTTGATISTHGVRRSRAGFHRDDETLATALLALPPADHCFEFRHPSWFVGDVYVLLEQHGASLALGDDKRRKLPRASPIGPVAYLRLHYGSRGRDGNWRGFAPHNALTLREGLG